MGNKCMQPPEEELSFRETSKLFKNGFKTKLKEEQLETENLSHDLLDVPTSDRKQRITFAQGTHFNSHQSIINDKD